MLMRVLEQKTLPFLTKPLLSRPRRKRIRTSLKILQVWTLVPRLKQMNVIEPNGYSRTNWINNDSL